MEVKHVVTWINIALKRDATQLEASIVLPLCVT